MKYKFKLVPSAVAVAVALAFAPPSNARVTKIVVDRVAPLAGDATYETVTGRAFGELDPLDRHNDEITDLNRAPQNANHKAEYVASFFIVKPVDMSKSSGLMWHDVPNRGGRITISSDLRAQGDIGISSGWQGDNAGATAVPANASSATPVTPSSNEWVKAPVVSGVTGQIFGRIINRSGLNAAPLNVMGNPIPYFPANPADNSGATLKEHLNETINGVVTEGATIPNSDWKFCGGGTFAAPAPLTTLPVQVCMKNAWDPAKLYQLVYTVKDPYVLGAGTAAFRDVASFFRHASASDLSDPLGDPAGHLKTLAGRISKAIIRGSSQSGNFTRHYIFLGMNEDEDGRIVHDGAWPLIAGRRVANNSRWGQPDGVLELFQMGSEGPQWWAKYEDHVRDLPKRGILDRCKRTDTCPKIVETFGGSEVFALKMTTSWVGTDAKKDIPLPGNVRRYYLPSSTHGGGNGAMDENPPDTGVSCPGNNWGRGTLRANPVPATALVDRMRVALREWVLNGTQPPPSQWPTLRPLDDVVADDDDDDDRDDHGKGRDRDDDKHGKHEKWRPLLADPTMKDMGFPKGVPGIPDSIFKPENFIFPVFDYDWGPQYDESEANGVPTNAPPPILHVIKMLVPKVDADGNELGGVPTVLRDAPLGTYLGWNITAGPGSAQFDGRPFHAGQVCNYIGGMVPFAKTKAQRLANKDPRLSLEERYKTHAGYVAAVKVAADNAACRGYMLARGPAKDGSMPKCGADIPAGFPDDWVQVVNQAIDSNVCNQPTDGGKCNPSAP